MCWGFRALSSAFLAFFAAAAFGQAPPPRSTADILAVLEQHRPDAERAQRLRALAEREMPALPDPLDQARFLVERGRAAGELGLLARQREDLSRAFQLFPQGEPERYFTFVELRFVELQAGDYAAAMRQFERAPEIATGPGQRISAWSGLASMRAQTGDASGARKALEQAVDLLRSMEGTKAYGNYANGWMAQVNRARAMVLRHEGKLAESEAAFRQALGQWERQMENIPRLQRAGFTTPSTVNSLRVLLAWRNTGLLPVLLELNRFIDAELLVRDTLKRALETYGKHSPEAATALARMAHVVYEQGRYGEASALARAAVEIHLAIGSAPYAFPLANARRDLAAALVEDGRYAEAVKEFEAMRAGLLQSPTAKIEGVRTGNPAWIHALVRLGRGAEALEMARRMLQAQQKSFGEQIYSTMEAHGYLALALAADGRHDEALREFRVAVPRLLQAASERAGEEGIGLARATRLTRILQAYIATLAHHARGGTGAEAAAHAAEAFRISDVARGSSVQRALTAASARAAIRDPELARLAREEQDLGQRIASLGSILVDLLARPPEQSLPTVIAAIRKDLEALRAQRLALKGTIEKRFPEYASLVDPKPVDLETARKALRPGEALLVLYGTEERSFVWALPATGEPRFHAAALPAAEAEAIVDRLRKALDVGDAPLERFPRFDVDAAHRLYELLLRPVEPAWGGSRSLLVVPHGALARLPFAVLATRAGAPAPAGLPFSEYRAVDWLVRRVALTQLPSVSTLASLRSVRRERAPGQPFAGFGDPVFSASAAPAAASTATRGLRLRNALYGDPQAGRQAISVQMEQLARLPDTAEELEGIASVLGVPREALYLGARASEENVKNTDLSDRRVVAFATHGLVPGDLDGLTQPALALSNPRVTGEKDADGLLSMEEILGLRLNADWVVLSACNTASAGAAGEEALSGLGRAFFYAGARALLVSNWPVETVSAKLLTTDVFRRQAADAGLGRAEALRRAMLGLLEKGEGLDREGKPLFAYSHPMFWAPFSLVGDGQ